jgi:hypothetical protein
MMIGRAAGVGQSATQRHAFSASNLAVRNGLRTRSFSVKIQDRVPPVQSDCSPQ